MCVCTALFDQLLRSLLLQILKAYFVPAKLLKLLAFGSANDCIKLLPLEYVVLSVDQTLFRRGSTHHYFA